MVKNNQATIALLLVAITSARTGALPQPASVEKVVNSDSPDRDSTASIDLPFLQFKNGGIRVNFAGYHAEAGLGGLLGGSNAGGGLYASAGTPWGPSASAGLGGSLGGADGSARGGLHARAGLGNGRPDAVAGLGGSLDGTGLSGSHARGGLYAGAGPEGFKSVAGLDGFIDGAGKVSGRSYRTGINGRRTKVIVKDISNIQPIAPISSGENVHLAKSGDKEPSTTLEFKLPASNEKKALSSSFVADESGNLASKNNVEGPNGLVAAADVPNVADVIYLPRRYYRKRIRSPARKQVIYKYLTTNEGSIDDVPAVAGTSNHPDGIVTHQAIENRTDSHVDVPHAIAARAASRTFFDDIFNIPISTLAAVNQMLNNKAG